MRCPKCGFISFDHLASCSKCGRDISEVASELQGTSIKVAPPMFLSGALAAFAESEESFEEHAMEDDVAGGIDFNMEMEDEVDFSFEEEEEAFDVAPEEDADFEIVEEEEGADISLAEAEAEEAGIAEEDVDIELEAEAEDTFEELDFMSSVEEEEGGLEFDLEDFIEDRDDDEPQTSGDADVEGLDLDLDDEEK